MPSLNVAPACTARWYIAIWNSGDLIKALWFVTICFSVGGVLITGESCHVADERALQREAGNRRVWGRGTVVEKIPAVLDLITELIILSNLILDSGGSLAAVLIIFLSLSGGN